MGHECIRHKAVYTQPSNPSHLGNPLIEALPAPKDRTEWFKSLMLRPVYNPSERFGDEATRLDAIQAILRFHQPDGTDVEIAFKTDRCLRWGYVCRNPLSSDYPRLYLPNKGGEKYNIPAYEHRTYGFSIIGISGIGKTTTMEMILNKYPQVIEHHEYQGRMLFMKQVVWLKVDIPADGLVKGFCMAYFRRLDTVLGTDYAETMAKRRATLDTMVSCMEKTVITHNIGILVLDELQHLAGVSPSQAETMLNFLVTIVNTLGIPIITIGTPKALELYGKELQQAKRGSGQGSVFWDRIKDRSSWSRFMKAMWQYQYTREEVPLTGSLDEAFYSEAQGIPFVAVHLYKLVQERAILNRTETFSEKDVHMAASRDLKLTEPMRRALREGKEVDLQNYLDIRPLTERFYGYFDIGAEKAAPAEAPAPKASVGEDAIRLLCSMKFSPGDAEKAVHRAIADGDGHQTLPSLVQKALGMLMQPKPEGTNKENTTRLDDMDGYKALGDAGLIDRTMAV